MDRRYKFILESLKSFDVSLNGKKVIDCGCGDGDGAKVLQNAGADLLAIDFDPVQVKKSRKSGIKHAQQGDVRKLDISDNYCDVFVSSETLEHLTETDGIKAAQEICRIVRPNGIICITVPSDKKGCLANPSHKNYISEADLKKWFNSCEVILCDKFIKNASRPKRANLVMVFKMPK